MTLNDDRLVPQLGFGVFQVAARARPRRRSSGPRGGLPPHRHGPDVRQRGGGRARRSRRPGSPREELYVTTKLNNGFHRPDDARAAIRRHRSTSSGWTTSTCSSSTGRCPRATTGTTSSTWQTLIELRQDGGPAPSASRTSSPPTSTGRSPRPASCRPSTRSRCTPTSATRAARGRRAHGIATEAWSPIAQGEVLDDAGDRRDRRAGRPDTRPRSRCAGTSSAATSCSRSRRTRADARRTSRSSTSSSPTTTSPRSPPSTAARPAAPVPTRTRWTGWLTRPATGSSADRPLGVLVRRTTHLPIGRPPHRPLGVFSGGRPVRTGSGGAAAAGTVRRR